MRTKKLYIILAISSGACLIIILTMFWVSEDMMHRKNPFIRSFPANLVTYGKQKDLAYNSYYFAGYKQGVIYLGNHTAPLHVLAVDTALHTFKQIRITLNEQNLPFRNLQLRVNPPYFYLMDGNLPCVFTGRTNHWTALSKITNIPYFTQIEPIDSINFAFRGNRSDTGANILGTFKITNPPSRYLAYNLLQEQPNGDGIFGTDGQLLFNRNTQRLIYTYRYCNQFLIADQNAKLLHRGHTIDTTYHANIKVAQHKGFQKMAAPPLSVNIQSATCNNLLFINSTLRGQLDHKNSWKNASTIDVYNLITTNYLFSFYIPAINGKKMSRFIVTPQHIFCIINTQLVTFTINESLKKELHKPHKTSKNREQYTGLYQGKDRKPVKKSRS